MRKPPGKNHDIRATEGGVFVPDELGLLPNDMFGRVVGIVVAVRTGKDDDGEAHGFELEYRSQNP